MADRGTVIGRYVSVGSNVRRIGAAHPVDGPLLHPYSYIPRFGYVPEGSDVERTGILIEDDAWIGVNVVILPGCMRIGVGAVVGAGAVVTEDVPDFAVVAGVPAKIKSFRLDTDTRARLLEVRPWQYPPSECVRVASEVLMDKRSQDVID
jgi:acetyltransferase-like isoleucine patch superfamily enzyme